MVSPLGNSAATTVVAKKATEKKEEKKPEAPKKPVESPEAKKPAEDKKPEESSDKPKAENAGESKETKTEDPTTFTGALDPKATFAVSQRIGKPKNANGGEGDAEKKADPKKPNAGEPADKQKDDPKKPNASEPADKQKDDPKKPNASEPADKQKDDPKDTKEKDKEDMAEGLLEKLTGKPDKTDKPNKTDKPEKDDEKKPEKDDEKKPDKPEKMTARRSLDTLIEKDNAGLKKLDVAKDKIKKGKDDPEGDDKISTEDINLALSKKGYLTKEEAEAAKFMRDTGVWDDVNKADSKATFKEIITYRNERTSPDEKDGQRPEGEGTGKVESNGEIDKKVKQGDSGKTGDCWWLSTVNAVNNSEEGKKIIKDTIKKNDDGSYAVKFKGDENGKTYTVTEEMVFKNKNSKGDDDMKILEEGARQYFYDNPTDSDGKSPIKNGEDPRVASRLLTGKETTGEGSGRSGLDYLDMNKNVVNGKGTSWDGKISTEDLELAEKSPYLSDEDKENAKKLRESDGWDEINGNDSKATTKEINDWADENPDTEEAKIIKDLDGNKEIDKKKAVEDFKNNPNGVMTFTADPPHVFLAAFGKKNAYTGAGKNSHAYTVISIDGDRVTYTNPWDSSKKMTMSVDSLLKADNIYYTEL